MSVAVNQHNRRVFCRCYARRRGEGEIVFFQDIYLYLIARGMPHRNIHAAVAPFMRKCPRTHRKYLTRADAKVAIASALARLEDILTRGTKRQRIARWYAEKRTKEGQSRPSPAEFQTPGNVEEHHRTGNRQLAPRPRIRHTERQHFSDARHDRA